MAEDIKKDMTQEEEERIVTLVDEKGEEVNFYLSATIEYKGKQYAFLQPAEEMDDVEEDEVVIFEIKDDPSDPDSILLDPVEDEELLDEVYHEYEKLEEEYDDEDGCGHCGCGCEEHEDECGCGEDCDCEDDCDCGK